MSSTADAQPARAMDLAPPTRYGMRTLDKSQFDLLVPVTWTSVPAQIVRDIQKEERLKGQLLNLPKVIGIFADPDDPKNRRRVLLRAKSPEEVSEEARAYFDELGVQLNKDELVLGWDYWNANELLHAILPPNGEEIPSSYTQTGHIAHVNLREEWLPYKHIIGQVLLEKLPTIKTVVIKLDTIHNVFRFFDMEVVAGEPEFVTNVAESGCRFSFDFSKVYWNSRLHTEHARVIDQFAPGCFVADAMAGVGPFAIPAAKRGAYVLGNDLNPECAKWMQVNVGKNKVSERMRVSNLDAREFIRRAPLEAWMNPFHRSKVMTNKEKDRQRSALTHDPQARAAANAAKATPPKPQTIDHFVMNLPDTALEFLDAYHGAFKPLLSETGYDRNTTLPLVHVHCFTRFLDFAAARDDINARASGYLGHPVDPKMDGYDLHLVRRVAPAKDMYCLTFRLPAEVAYA